MFTMRATAKRGTKKGLAIAGFIFSLVGALLFWVPLLGTLLTLLSVVFSKSALNWIRHDRYAYGGTAFALAGFVIGIIFLILSVIVLIVFCLLLLFGYLAGKALG
jgi:hypothetical protein